jgi:pseudouridine-5'-phosphate glycosidase
MTGRTAVRTSPEVAEALGAGRPVVALETAVLTHGLPRDGSARPRSLAPGHHAAELLHGHAWNESAPCNLEAVRAVAAAVRAVGAVPASVGVMHGELVIGLDDDELSTLALDESAKKASSRDLGPLAATGSSAGTTVAATMRACRLASPQPIRVFATGGIGGVHRGWQQRPDISADLRALANEPVAVVASGAKVILDVAATLEALDTLGVPVIGVGTDGMPIFTAGVDADLAPPHRLDDPAAIAAACRRHWDDFGQSSGVLLANPCPADAAADPRRIDALVDAGLAEASSLGIDGGDVTPFLLASMIGQEDVDPLGANIALLISNAALAARVAVAFAAG